MMLRWTGSPSACFFRLRSFLRFFSRLSCRSCFSRLCFFDLRARFFRSCELSLSEALSLLLPLPLLRFLPSWLTSAVLEPASHAVAAEAAEDAASQVESAARHIRDASSLAVGVIHGTENLTVFLPASRSATYSSYMKLNVFHSMRNNS